MPPKQANALWTAAVSGISPVRSVRHLPGPYPVPLLPPLLYSLRQSPVGMWVRAGLGRVQKSGCPYAAFFEYWHPFPSLFPLPAQRTCMAPLSLFLGVHFRLRSSQERRSGVYLRWDRSIMSVKAPFRVMCIISRTLTPVSYCPHRVPIELLQAGTLHPTQGEPCGLRNHLT